MKFFSNRASLSNSFFFLSLLFSQQACELQGGYELGAGIWSSSEGSIAFQTELASTCHQYGYSRSGMDYARRKYESLSFDAMSAGIRKEFIQNQLRCINPSLPDGGDDEQLAKSLVTHITADYAGVMPSQMGGIFMGDQWYFTGNGNNNYYQFEEARGTAEVMAHLGFNANIHHIYTNGQWGTAQTVLQDIKKSRLAGLKYIWIQLVLKDDCCSARNVPAPFSGSTSNPSALYAKVKEYAKNNARTMLEGTQLPIVGWEFGNEVDGGFWVGFDASQSYDGPPDNIARTKAIMQAARQGIIEAYKEKGLGRPFFTLHVMPANPENENKIKTNIGNFLSATYVNEKLFDVLSYSEYPNARGIDPIKVLYTKKKTAEYFVSQGLVVQWFDEEFAVANSLALGKSGSGADTAEGEWNNNTDWANTNGKNECKNFFNSSCTSLEDMQAKMVEKMMSIFMSSPSYGGGHYLAPQHNFYVEQRDSQGNILGDDYRLGLFKWAGYITGIPPKDGSGPKAELLPAAFKLRDATVALYSPKLNSGRVECPATGNCTVSLYGLNLARNAVLLFTHPDNYTSFYYPYQILVAPPAKILMQIQAEDSNKLRSNKRIAVKVLSLSPFTVDSVSNSVNLTIN